MIRVLPWTIVLAAACGRFDFDDLAPPGDTMPANSGPITRVQTFSASQSGVLEMSHTFTAAAVAAGDLVLLHIYCGAAVPPTAFSITAPGWSLVTVGQTGGTAMLYAYTIAAIAPDTAMATFTVDWTSTSSCDHTDDLGDEFGGGPFDVATAIDDHDEEAGTGDCTSTLTTHHGNDTVWAACTTQSLGAVGAGFTKGADDQHGDWTEFRSTTDPAGATESPSFSNDVGEPFVMTAVAVTTS